MKATVIAVMVMADVEARVAVDGDSSTINESDGGNGAAGSSQPTNQPTHPAGQQGRRSQFYRDDGVKTLDQTQSGQRGLPTISIEERQTQNFLLSSKSLWARSKPYVGPADESKNEPKTRDGWVLMQYLYMPIKANYF